MRLGHLNAVSIHWSPSTAETPQTTRPPTTPRVRSFGILVSYHAYRHHFGVAHSPLDRLALMQCRETDLFFALTQSKYNRDNYREVKDFIYTACIQSPKRG